MLPYLLSCLLSQACSRLDGSSTGNSHHDASNNVLRSPDKDYHDLLGEQPQELNGSRQRDESQAIKEQGTMEACPWGYIVALNNAPWLIIATWRSVVFTDWQCF